MNDNPRTSRTSAFISSGEIRDPSERRPIVELGRAVIEDAIRDIYAPAWEAGKGRRIPRREIAEKFLLRSKEVAFWADCAEINLEDLRRGVRKLMAERDEKEGGR